MLKAIEGLQSVESLHSFSRVPQRSRGGRGLKGRSTLALHGVGVGSRRAESSGSTQDVECRVSRKAFAGGLAMGNERKDELRNSRTLTCTVGGLDKGARHWPRDQTVWLELLWPRYGGTKIGRRVSVGVWLCGDYGTEERLGSICPSVPVGLHDTEQGIRKAGLIIWALHFAPVCTDCVSKVKRIVMLWKINFHYSIIYLLYGKMPYYHSILVCKPRKSLA